MTGTKTKWLQRGWVPHHIGFCPSRKAWRKTAKHLEHNNPYPHDDNPAADGLCTTFLKTEKTSRCSVITISKRLDKKWNEDQQLVLGVIVHECVHAYQDVLESMEEKRPGAEFEAYTIQAIFIRVLAAYIKTRVGK